MTQPELGPEYDPSQELLDNFVQIMDTVSRAISAFSGGHKPRFLDLTQNRELVNKFLDHYPEIKNHPIIGSRVRVTPIEKPWGNMTIYDHEPWLGGIYIGDAPVEGTISSIYPGIGMLITRQAENMPERFVYMRSFRGDDPECELTMIRPSQSQTEDME